MKTVVQVIYMSKYAYIICGYTPDLKHLKFHSAVVYNLVSWDGESWFIVQSNLMLMVVEMEQQYVCCVYYPMHVPGAFIVP